MAFARLFPIDATDAQDGDRTLRLSLSDGTSYGSAARTDDCGHSPLLALLKRSVDGVATSPEDHSAPLASFSRPSTDAQIAAMSAPVSVSGPTTSIVVRGREDFIQCCTIRTLRNSDHDFDKLNDQFRSAHRCNGEATLAQLRR
jgi:hypothetical protein